MLVAEPPYNILYWAKILGADSSSLKKLSGGINNPVYQCSSRYGKWVIKGFPARSQESRDRFIAEYQFVEYASKAATHYVPRLVYKDELTRCIVYDYIDGYHYLSKDKPSGADIKDALDFLRLINMDHSTAKSLIRQDASEGFLSLTEHLSNINSRIDSMNSTHLHGELKSTADSKLDDLRSCSLSLSKRLDSAIGSGAVNDSIRRDELVVSPSDFGFHNAIKTQRGLKFFDFEFAGWDDPLKMYFDFILQPRVPVMKSPYSITMVIGNSVELDSERAHLMLELLKLKWRCIVLGFLSEKRLNALKALDSCFQLSIYAQRQLTTDDNLTMRFSHIKI